ncbi:MAG: DUF368 domain-containing protein [Clostridia bacterium]|nr:DUF368 domain-containing protein [Clostridia bacterium]
MGEKNLEIALVKYNKKTWCKSGLLGIIIGLAVIVPGISGSTVAIIFKLYDQFLYALGNLFKKFKQCFAFLLPIALGMIVGLVVGFLAVQKLLDLLPFAIVGLFAGLMAGAFPAVTDEIKGAARTKKRIALFAVGLLVPIAVGIFSAVFSADAGTANGNKFDEIAWWHLPASLFIGYLLGITQIAPGLSASAILMAVGWFSSLVDGVSLSYFQENPTVLFVYGGLAVGFVLAILTFSKFLTYIFGKARQTAYTLIVGLSLGSIVSMFCNGDIVAVYADWAKNGLVWWDLLLGIALFAVGVVGSYLLVKYQRKKDSEKAERLNG